RLRRRPAGRVQEPTPDRPGRRRPAQPRRQDQPGARPATGRGGGVMSGTSFPIEEGHVRAFALALGEDVDVVPPTFPIAFAHVDPEWPLRMRPGEPWNGSGAEPGVSSGGGGLHAEQEFEYLRPIRVGETLMARKRQGRTWQRTGRSGVL